jgi:SAM-dependent methyltransferase
MSSENLSTSTGTTFHRHWSPIPEVTNFVVSHCRQPNNPYHTVLEIGPGSVPFEPATLFIGCHETIEHYTNVDIDNERFPFEDQSIDFVYCRHVLEDIQNPDVAMQEIIRISKHGGYIETPSPLVEITKNVDSPEFSYLYCGYIHHRYLVWGNMQKNELYFLPKYSCILDHLLQANSHDPYELLNTQPILWNNYFLFTTHPTVIVYKNGVNFNVHKGAINMATEYAALVSRAVQESIENTHYFMSLYRQKQETIEVLQSLSP